MIARLPVGIKLESQDKVYREIEIKPLDGYSREILSDKKYLRNHGKLTTAILSYTIQKLGEDIFTEDQVRSMFTVDRNAVMIQLQIGSVGDTVPAEYICKWCNAGFKIIEDLNDLDYTDWDDYKDTIELQLEKGYTDKEGTLHRDLTLGLPTGLDEEVTAPLLRENYGLWCNTMIARKSTKFGSLDMSRFVGSGLKVAKSLSVVDIDQIIEAITVDLPGYDLRHDINCPDCSKDTRQILDMSSFF